MANTIPGNDEVLNPYPTETANVVSRPAGQSMTDDQTINIQLDIVSKEQHDLKNTVTNHPVEQGSDITDHVRPEPNTFSMDCVISNTPLPPYTPSPTRGSDAYAALKALRDTGALCSVITTLKRYTNVVVTNVSITRDSGTYDGLTFTVSFQEIVIVQNALTRTVVAKDKRVGKKVETGAQTPNQNAVETSRARASSDSYQKTKGSTSDKALAAAKTLAGY